MFDDLFGEVDAALSGFVESDVFQIGIRVLVVYFVLIWLASAFWAYRDMRLRSASAFTPYVAAAAIIVFTPDLLPLRAPALPHRAAQGDDRRGQRADPRRGGDAGRGRPRTALRQLLAAGPRGLDHLPHLPQPTAPRVPQLRAPRRARLDALRLVRQGLRACRGARPGGLHAFGPPGATTAADSLPDAPARERGGHGGHAPRVRFAPVGTAHPVEPATGGAAEPGHSAAAAQLWSLDPAISRPCRGQPGRGRRGRGQPHQGQLALRRPGQNPRPAPSLHRAHPRPGSSHPIHLWATRT